METRYPLTARGSLVKDALFAFQETLGSDVPELLWDLLEGPPRSYERFRWRLNGELELTIPTAGGGENVLTFRSTGDDLDLGAIQAAFTDLLRQRGYLAKGAPRLQDREDWPEKKAKAKEYETRKAKTTSRNAVQRCFEGKTGAKGPRTILLPIYHQYSP